MMNMFKGGKSADLTDPYVKVHIPTNPEECGTYFNSMIIIKI